VRLSGMPSPVVTVIVSVWNLLIEQLLEDLGRIPPLRLRGRQHLRRSSPKVGQPHPFEDSHQILGQAGAAWVYEPAPAAAVPNPA